MRIQKRTTIILSILVGLAVILILIIALNQSGKPHKSSDLVKSTENGTPAVNLAVSTGKEMESLFGSLTTVASQTDNTALELGQVFQSNAPGSITDIKVYALAEESGEHIARIWRNQDNTIIAGPYTIPYAGKAGWITFHLPQPIAIEEYTDYTISVSRGADAGKVYPHLPLPEAGNNGGHLSWPAQSGRYTNLASARPVNVTSTGDGYLNDIVFEPSPMSKPDAKLNLQSLDGSWRIVQDTKNEGGTGQWQLKAHYPLPAAVPIQVPGNVGEAFPNFNGVTWYARSFQFNLQMASDMKYYLRFGAVQYKSEVWLNGKSLGLHEGSDTSFELDATGALVEGENFIVVKAENETGMVSLPVVFGSGGMVDHVTLAKQPLVRIKDVFAAPDIQTGEIQLQITMENNTAAPVSVALNTLYGEFKGKDLGSAAATINIPSGQSVQNMKVTVPSPHLWALDDPFLYRIKVTAQAGEKQDDYNITHFGFRDFRITNGYFYLNNKRIFVKSLHGTARFDPVTTLGTPRDMSIMNKQYAKLKNAGFNMLRTLQSASLPEQLDLADELGLLIYEEHEGSWNLGDATKFTQEITGNLQRDRNHPSIVIWGLLNETKANQVYDEAKAFLPDLRKLDPTRLVLLGSGRFDGDLKTASASNPGSSEWNVYLGGEDASNPTLTGALEDLGPNAYTDGAGDIHVYNKFPITWNFLTSFEKLGKNTKNIFLSEAGAGSMYNAILDQQKALQANTPSNSGMLPFATERIANLTASWKKFGLDEVYPNVEDALVDSEKSEAKERAVLLSAIRSNPRIIGYSLTSLFDGSAGEGVMDNFRDWKAGHESVLKDGWAKLKWNLFVNPMSIYTDSQFHVKVSLANEDVLKEGDYAASLVIKDSSGKPVWTSQTHIKVQGGIDPPLAYSVFDKDITVSGLTEGKYTLSAALINLLNASADALEFNVFSKDLHPGTIGDISVLGVNPAVRKLLKSHGAIIHEYSSDAEIDHEAILVGEGVKADAAAWQALYKKAAKGAHIVFLADKLFSDGGNGYKWLAVVDKGNVGTQANWLYHQENIAKPDPIMNGLPAKLLTPDVYGNLINALHYLKDVTPPDITTAAAIYNSYGAYSDGLLIGTYIHHAGKFTVNSFDLIGNMGNPVADRMLLNLAVYAKSDAAVVTALPANYASELDSLGIK